MERYRKAVFIVTYINKPRKYLILKRKLHWKGWEFPKGGVKNKEPLMLAVLREIMEETGQIPSEINKFDVYGKYKYDKGYADRPDIIGQDYTLFSAELKSSKIKLDKKEHSGFKFVNYKQALKMLTWQNQKKCLKIVNSRI